MDKREESIVEVKDIEIRTKNLVLREYTKELVETYHKWMQDPWLRDKTASELLSIEDEYKAQEEWLHDINKQTFIIFDKLIQSETISKSINQNTAGMCGDVNLFIMDSDASESYSLIESALPVLAAEIMIMIAEPWARRKGYATEAVHAMMHFGIQIRGIRRFVAKIDDSNQASIGLFTQLGFRVAKKMPYFSEIHMALDITADIETRLQSSVEQMKH